MNDKNPDPDKRKRLSAFAAEARASALNSVMRAVTSLGPLVADPELIAADAVLADAYAAVAAVPEGRTNDEYNEALAEPKARLLMALYTAPDRIGDGA